MFITKALTKANLNLTLNVYYIHCYVFLSDFFRRLLTRDVIDSLYILNRSTSDATDTHNLKPWNFNLFKD